MRNWRKQSQDLKQEGRAPGVLRRVWVRAGSGAELSAMGGIKKLSATHPLQLERQTCCSMSANSCYNLPTGELVISLLVFPCFLFSR